MFPTEFECTTPNEPAKEMQQTFSEAKTFSCLVWHGLHVPASASYAERRKRSALSSEDSLLRPRLRRRRQPPLPVVASLGLRGRNRSVPPTATATTSHISAVRPVNCKNPSTRQTAISGRSGAPRNDEKKKKITKEKLVALFPEPELEQTESMANFPRRISPVLKL